MPGLSFLRYEGLSIIGLGGFTNSLNKKEETYGKRTLHQTVEALSIPDG